MFLINKRTPTLHEMELFAALAVQRSFSATAEQLGVSAAYVSKTLQNLETRLGMRLMHRTTRKVSLTEQGELLLERGQRLLESAQDLMDAMQAERTVPQGQLRLCSSSGYGRSVLAPVLSGFANAYPALDIQLELLDRKVDLISEGFHLDIRVGAIEQQDMICKLLRNNRRILCASPSYIQRHGALKNVDALAHHACLVIRERDQTPGRWALQGPQGEVSVRVSGRLSSNNGEAVRQWALDGHGIALRSQWDVHDDLRAGRLVQVLPDYCQEAPVHAVYPSRLASSAKLRLCVEYLQAKLPGLDWVNFVRWP